ncbi:endonuclease/exonuclease/phosphatase family protein [Pseudobutyrivibrio xylanivorans]|uniref:Endonuclease/exonuclease/phosphatase family protein n=1 Tax=Pseudobutyrivibrio xylanivorans TaxID=185007 RepID=A0A5P6VW02_PSEXY|nr:endonuclease/exonuclease/phosphatase family protein [Pseudobutyrivibrio xylanivorans]QFJ55711.1 endonuclease/exonuclease/phosphatase family protein [Pseudobutyrivibrio xylanivorans]
MIKKLLKFLLTIIIALVVLFAIYCAYVFISYHRIDDMTALEIENNSSKDVLEKDTSYTIASGNLGFGAYSDDYSFFMDGGTESWAFSKTAVYNNINGSIDVIKSLNPDLILLQEVDLNSTRSYHINEKDIILENLAKTGTDKISTTFSINYDSPFLMYPITQPHGKTLAGEFTISSVNISKAIRRSLPIEEGLSKLIDLDRCYAKNYIPVEGGVYLVLYNVHLSAYTTDPSTADNQVKMLNEDMLAEVEAGNYVIAGGDMNKDVLGDSTKYFGTSAKDQYWAVAFPEELLDSCFTVVKPVDPNNPVPSCRNADSPYNENSFVITIDGFIVSSNVEVSESNVVDTGFKYSDHNPIYMDFKLK